MDGVRFGELDTHDVVDALPESDGVDDGLLAADSVISEEAVPAPLADAAEVDDARPEVETPGVNDTIGLPLKTGETLASALAESGADCESAAEADRSGVALVVTVFVTSGLTVGDTVGGAVSVAGGDAEVVDDGVESVDALTHAVDSADTDAVAESVEAPDALASPEIDVEVEADASGDVDSVAVAQADTVVVEHVDGEDDAEVMDD